MTETKIITEAGMEAHKCDDTWYVMQNGSKVAEIQITTSRKRRDDLSGMKNYRVVTRSDIEISLSLGYKVAVDLDYGWMHKAEIAALREIMTGLSAGYLMRFAQSKLEDVARQAGVPEIKILNAYNADEKKHTRNLFELI